ncbi:MAG: 2-C-methyl-D-erythritol 2,4-cyclodiphosphate synthase [Lachnospiraceae bacterium]|nr:2-C-methyl-D-erythritol 2,4-cyclodiphosphate synthase [Lachnospiraceae bacterium]
MKISFEEGKLENHSDANVVVYAIIDVLLGAGALRDIGYNFWILIWNIKRYIVWRF